MSAVDAIPLPAVLWKRLNTMGIDPANALRMAQLPASLLGDPHPKVSTAGFFALWRSLQALDPTPDLGLRLGSSASAGEMDVVSFAALHAPNFGDALGKLARYKRLVCPEEIRIAPVCKGIAVSFHWLFAREAPPPGLVDACLASVLALGQRGIGRMIRPLRVELARARQQGAELESHFGCVVRFGAAEDAIVFASETLLHSFVTARADLLSILLPGLDAALAADTASLSQPSLAARVRRALRRQMQGQRPTIAGVAHEVGLSVRTMQRMLAKDGTSYQALLTETRDALACELLERTELDSGEIAFVLGFEEINSFIRAFSDRRGTTPMRWRRLQRATPSKIDPPSSH